MSQALCSSKRSYNFAQKCIKGHVDASPRYQLTRFHRFVVPTEFQGDTLICLWAKLLHFSLCHRTGPSQAQPRPSFSCPSLFFLHPTLPPKPQEEGLLRSFLAHLSASCLSLTSPDCPHQHITQPHNKAVLRWQPFTGIVLSQSPLVYQQRDGKLITFWQLPKPFLQVSLQKGSTERFFIILHLMCLSPN